MYEAPKLERFGNFRELTKGTIKINPTFDVLLPNGQGDGPPARS